jgi:hypothetical protein
MALLTPAQYRCGPALRLGGCSVRLPARRGGGSGRAPPSSHVLSTKGGRGELARRPRGSRLRHGATAKRREGPHAGSRRCPRVRRCAAALARPATRCAAGPYAGTQGCACPPARARSSGRRRQCRGRRGACPLEPRAVTARGIGSGGTVQLRDGSAGSRLPPPERDGGFPVGSHDSGRPPGPRTEPRPRPPCLRRPGFGLRAGHLQGSSATRIPEPGRAEPRRARQRGEHHRDAAGPEERSEESRATSALISAPSRTAAPLT